MATDLSKIIAKGDRRLWTWYLATLAFSILITASSTTTLSILSRGSVFFYWFKHLIFILSGAVLVYFVSRMPREYLNLMYNLADALLYVSGFLLIITLFFGVEKAEAKRWLTVFGFQFQPSEFAKFSMILYAAKQLTIAARHKKQAKKALDNLFWTSLVIAGLIATNNLSTAVIILTIVIGLIFIAEISEEQRKRLIKNYAIIAAFGLLLILLMPGHVFRSSTWRNRIKQMIYPHYSYADQSTQAKIAIAKGGLVNLKLGKGEQKALIPQEYSDYLFSVIVEELGLFGGVLTIILYLWLLSLIARMVSRLKRTFLVYVIAGFGLSIEIQAFVHIMVNVGLIPVTGQPLPFMSLGGTSILFNSLMIGIIISISRYVKKNPKPVYNEPVDFTLEKNKIILN